MVTRIQAKAVLVRHVPNHLLTEHLVAAVRRRQIRPAVQTFSCWKNFNWEFFCHGPICTHWFKVILNLTVGSNPHYQLFDRVFIFWCCRQFCLSYSTFPGFLTPESTISDRVLIGNFFVMDRFMYRAIRGNPHYQFFDRAFIFWCCRQFAYYIRLTRGFLHKNWPFPKAF